MKAEQLYQSPNKIACHYSKFNVSGRLLLTGHSHQAWPDCAVEGQMQALEDAAQHVDKKWEFAFARAQAIKTGFADLIEDHTQNIVLGTNTHELVIKFLSALPLIERPKLITTDAEFHTIRRQLDRIGEERIQIIKIPAYPEKNIAAQLGSIIDDKTAAVLISKVFYNTGILVENLDAIANLCQHVGAQLLVDAYHAINVVPFSVKKQGLESAFIVGGGYKYCQLGEGNCFLRVPPGCNLRPVITGWFSEFEDLAEAGRKEAVQYPKNAARFSGSTYDPTSHYRGAEVFNFFNTQGLTPELLHQVNRHQMKLLINFFDALDADPRIIDYDRSIPLDHRGGFLVLNSPCAHLLQQSLSRKGVLTDHRGTGLRFGPAPYLSDNQLIAAMQYLGEAIRENPISSFMEKMTLK